MEKIMEIEKIVNGDEFTFKISGELNVLTSPDLEKYINENVEGSKKVIFDLEKLTYISSAGLRTILVFQKSWRTIRNFVIRNLTEEVREVFALTGFTEILNIEY